MTAAFRRVREAAALEQEGGHEQGRDGQMQQHAVDQDQPDLVSVPRSTLSASMLMVKGRNSTIEVTSPGL